MIQDYYVVSDYGYGDGECIGPFGKADAIKELCGAIGIGVPQTEEERDGMFRIALEDSSAIHYLSEMDLSDGFSNSFSDS